MDSTSIATLSSWATLAVTVLPALALAYIWYRTRSSHLLDNRLWQLVNGSQEIEDPEIKQVISEKTSLMRFRFAFGIQAQSHAQALEVIRWAKKQQVDMTQLAACGDYFDLKAMALKPILPSSRRQRALSFFHVVPFGLAFAAFIGLGTPEALVSLKETGKWFWLTENTARVLTPLGSTSLRRDDCPRAKGTPPSSTNFTSREIEIVCDAFASDDQQAKDKGKDIASFVRDAVYSQRVIMGALFAFAVGLGLVVFSLQRNIKAAFSLRDELDERAQIATEEQLTAQD